MRTAYIIGCISHGHNDVTNGGAVLLVNELFQKKIHFLFFLPLIVIFTLFTFQLPAASAATVTIAWDVNSEPNPEGYILYYGITSHDYIYNVDIGNLTSCTISGLEPGQVYYFAATAYNIYGESEFSEELSYEIPFDNGMPDEIILDNGDEGTSFSGTWRVSSCPDPYGESSLYSNDPEAYYAYEASIAGLYTVSLWWTEHAVWRINNVPVQIFDGDTLLDTVYVNQQTNGGQWNVLGEYDFSGTARVVVISETDGSTGNDSTCVDALRLVSTEEGSDDIFHITASAGSGGDISPVGDVTVNRGSSESFVIVADANHHIVDVTVDGTSIGPVSSYSFNNVSHDHTIAATFALNTYTIAASAGGCGIISPSGTATVNHGAEQSYAILPQENCHIANVRVDGQSVGTPTTYTFDNVISNHTIVVDFAVNNHTITASAGENGGISPQGAISVSNGSSQSFTITPGANYHVLDVVVDGTSVGAVTAYTFNNVTANHTIAASFEVDTHNNTINASAGENGSISPQGAVSVPNGSSLSFTITPNANYHVLDVMVDGVSVGAVTAYTFDNVTADHSITASFAVDTHSYTINASAGANGSISPQGAVSVDSGSSQSFTITPNANYHVLDVMVDGVSVGAVTEYTFDNVTADHSISASFQPIPIHTLTLGVGPDGAGTISPAIGDHTYSEGEVVAATATANAGYRFVNWTGNIGGVADPTSPSISVTMDTDRTIIANFEETGLGPEPVFISLTPADHTSSVGEPVDFMLTMGDGNGHDDIADVRFVIKEGIGTGTTSDGIILWWTANRPDHIYLWNHESGRWNRAAFGSSTILEDTNCSLDASRSNIMGDGQILTISLNIIPKAAFIEAPLGSDKRVWLQLRDTTRNLFREEISTWSVIP